MKFFHNLLCVDVTPMNSNVTMKLMGCTDKRHSNKCICYCNSHTIQNITMRIKSFEYLKRNFVIESINTQMYANKM